MEKPCNYLFVYGTLLVADNHFAAYLKANSTFYSKAKFKGVLYDIGTYPGVIAKPDYDGWVYGSIFYMEDPVTIFEELDDYEGFGPAHSEPYLFVRELLEVETDGQKLLCWIYLYNLSVDGRELIISGDYLKYKFHQ